MKNKLKLVHLVEENNTYWEVCFEYVTTERKNWFERLLYQPTSLKWEYPGMSFQPQQLIPCGRSFDVPFYAHMPKDNDSLEAGVLEDNILKEFLRANPKINESPDLFLGITAK